MQGVNHEVHIGIDLGGTKTELLALDANSGVELCKRRVPTERTYSGVVRGIRDLVFATDLDLGERGSIGIGIPGTISAETGLVKNANSTWINGKPLDRDLSEALGRAVRIENDANCFVMSEAHDGAGKGADVVFGVIIGTGTGAGIAIHGKCLKGANGIAGEWGHNPLPWPQTLDDGHDERPGRQCYCGRIGCIETWLSGPGLEADFLQQSAIEMSAEKIAAAASHNPHASAALARYSHRLARGVAHIINILDPDVIVLGGGMGKILSLYETVPKIWQPFIFSDTVRTRLVPPQHGDASGVRGAAWLWR